MKGRESGMPEKDYWNSFYDAECVVLKLIPRIVHGSIIEIGSGYGTFTNPVIKNWKNKFIGFEIEGGLASVLQNEVALVRENVEIIKCDIMEENLDIFCDEIGHVMLYNILHIENPKSLLRKIKNLLLDNGTISIIHWKYDSATPRGPSMEIRPKPQDISEWLNQCGYKNIEIIDLKDCCKYHYGITASI